MGAAVESNHDSASAPFDSASEYDVLSSVLDSVRLAGAMFFQVDVTPPWISKAPRASDFAKFVLPRARHVISYHAITKGTCWAGLTGEAPVRLATGDVLVVPHGDSYFLANRPDADSLRAPVVEVEFFKRMAAGELPPVVGESSEHSDATQVLCAFLGCTAATPSNLLLNGLPRVLHVRAQRSASDALDPLVLLALAEIRARRAGNRSVLLRLSELMFVEVLRRHVESIAHAGGEAPPQGWLYGLRDPIVARMLTALHAEPAQAWTVEALAKACGASRSVAAERFTALVGEPPMQYLTRWRMQLATGLLHEPSAKVGSVALATGYGSEAAFSRAFKKFAGVSPAVFRAR
jgi:AraC-like DNA-binding protein